MRVLTLSMTLVLTASALGCSKPPDQVAKEARAAAGSWGATLSAAAERWGNGDVSTSYLETVVTQARTSLQKEARTARKSAGEQAAAPVDAVASHLDAMAEAVSRGDRAAAIDAGHAAASETPAEKISPVARPR
jgi:hypothetical protein